MRPTVRPGPVSYLFPLGDGAVLFLEERQELHALNATAAVIWCLRDEGLEDSEIAAVLAKDAGLQPEEARAFVAAASEQWIAHKGPKPEATDTAHSWALSAPIDVSQIASQRHYAIGPVRLSIAYGTREHESLIHPILAHFEGSDTESATRFAIAETAEGTAILREGVVRALCSVHNELAPLMKWEVWSEGLASGHFLFNIHAGVVADTTGCILLPGPQGSGKSTLTAALVHSGFEFFSDEVALLADKTLEVLPFPLALCVKDTGLKALADLYPELQTLPLHQRGDGKRVAYLPPRRDRLPAADAHRPAVAIIFPQYLKGESGAVLPLAPAEALTRMLGQCMSLGAKLTAERVARLVRWIERVPCFELCFSELAWAVDAVRELRRKL